MAMRRNQPKVQARDACVEGMISSAIFRPGEKRETSQTGTADSLGTAQASARNPTRMPSMAGKTKRKNERCCIRSDSTKSHGGGRDKRH